MKKMLFVNASRQTPEKSSLCKYASIFRGLINPLSANNDQHQVSPHHISYYDTLQVMRNTKSTTKDKLHQYLNKFSQPVFLKQSVWR